jgi:hypothetical protein
VTLTGTNLASGTLTSITVGGATCTGASVVSSTQATCTAPAHAAGTASVVYTDSAAGALTVTLTYSAAAPTITSISPTSISTEGGATLTVNGTNFSSGTFTSITVGGATCTSPTYVSSTQYTCTTPTGTAGSATVTYTASTGSASSSVTYVQAGRLLSSTTLATYAHGTYVAGNGIDGAGFMGGHYLNAQQGTSYLLGTSLDGYNGANQVVRITSAGAVDGTFTTISQNHVQAVSVTYDSKIYAASITQPAGCSGTASGVTVKRYGSNGALDGTFSFSSVPAFPTSSDFSGTMSGCWTARVMPFAASDAFYLLLQQVSSTSGTVCIVEYQATGSVYTTFGQSGVLCVHTGTSSRWTSNTYVKELCPATYTGMYSANSCAGLASGSGASNVGSAWPMNIQDFLNVDSSNNLNVGITVRGLGPAPNYYSAAALIIDNIAQTSGVITANQSTALVEPTATGNIGYVYLGMDTNSQFLVQPSPASGSTVSDYTVSRYNLSAVKDGTFSINLGYSVAGTGYENTYPQAFLQSGGGYLLNYISGSGTFSTILTNSSGQLVTGFTSGTITESNFLDYAIFASDSTNQFTVNTFNLYNVSGGVSDQLNQFVWDKQ